MNSKKDADAAPPTSMSGQRLVNVVVRGLLATPLLARVIGNRLITLHVVGRKSGKRYDVPVAYMRDGETLVIGTPFAWARNVRTGEPLAVRYRGKRTTADVEVLREEEPVVRDYAAIARHNPTFASFNNISRDDAGEPDPGDLHRAWAQGARVLRLTVRG